VHQFTGNFLEEINLKQRKQKKFLFVEEGEENGERVPIV